MHDSDVSGLPVLKDGRLVGLINRTMMLAAFIEEMGLQVDSSRITLELDDTPGQILSITQIIKDLGLNIVSIATFFPEPTNKRLVVFRVKTTDPKPDRGGAARGRLQDRDRGGFRAVAAGR